MVKYLLQGFQLALYHIAITFADVSVDNRPFHIIKFQLYAMNSELFNEFLSNTKDIVSITNVLSLNAGNFRVHYVPNF